MNSVRRLNEAPPAGPHAVASAAAAAAAAGATGGGDDLTDKMTIYEGVITVLNREVEKLSTQVLLHSHTGHVTVHARTLP